MITRQMRRNVHVALRQKNGLPCPSRIHKESEVLNEVNNYPALQTFLETRAQTLISHFAILLWSRNAYRKFEWTSLVAMMTLFHGFSRTLLPSYLVLYVPFSIQQLLQVIKQTTGRRVMLHRFLKKTTSFLKQTTGLSLYYQQLTMRLKNYSPHSIKFTF